MSPRTEYVGRFEAKPEKRPSLRRVSGWLALLIILLVGAARLGTEAFRLLGYYDLFLSGRNLLQNQEVSSVEIADHLTDGEGATIPVRRLDDGKTVIYQGHTYHLNENLATVLVLGIDQKITEEDATYGEGGQCDVIMLVGLDTKTGEATVLNLSRESYGQVEVYAKDGVYIETRYEQLALAYAYGNGKDSSCENAVRAVSRILYGLPISSYVAIDMEGITEANEAVGGVTVVSMIDYDKNNIKFVKGEPVELHGEAVDRYIRYRTSTMTGNEARMLRQRQWLTEFSQLVVTRSIKRITFPVTLFSSLSPYMATSLKVPDVTFLSRCFLQHGARFEFRNVAGTYDILNKSAVYYLDEVDLFEAVLQVFYLRED